MSSRACTHCGETKPKRKFESTRYTCRTCRNEKQRSRRKSLAEEVRRYKQGRPCADCGGVFPPVCMDFDHVRGDKLFDVSQGHSKGSRDMLWKEIAKCELVCANCHRLRTATRIQDTK